MYKKKAKKVKKPKQGKKSPYKKKK